MKGKFTKIMAAVALLVGLTIPMGMWGQTRAEGDTHEFEQSLEQLLNNNASIPSITIPVQSYSVKKVTISYRYNKTIQNAVTMEVTVGGTSWGTKYSTGTGSNYTTVDFEGTSATGAIVISFTNNTGSGTGHGTFYVNNVTLTEGPGGSFPTTYTVTYNANGGTGTMTDPNSPYEEGDEVTLLDNTFDAPEGMMWDSWLVKDAGNNTISVTNNQFTMPSSNVNITAQWVTDPNAPQYEWALTDLADLTSSDVFVIVGTKSENTFAMSNATSSNCPEAITDVTVSGTRITSDVSEDMKWNIIVESNGYKFKPNGTEKYLAYGSSTTIHVGNYTSNNVFTYGVVDGNNYLQISSRYVCVATSDWRAYAAQNVSTNATNTLFYKRQIVNTDPAIYASNVNIGYDDLEGQIEYTLENGVSGGELTATTTSDWITLPETFASPITFTATENTMTEPRTAIVTLNYVKNGATLATKDVTVTQDAAPVTYTTIPELFAAATSTSTPVIVTFGGWVVTGVNGNQAFVTDGTNGFIIYQSDHGFVVGNTLSGTANCNLILFNASAEITDLTSTTEGLIVGENGTVTPVETTINTLQAVNTGSVVTLNNLTYDGTVLSDGTNEITPYNTLYTVTSTLVNGKTYNVTGVFVLNNTTKRILPRSVDDIEEVEVPSITITPAILDLNATGENGYQSGILSLTYENIEITNFQSFTIQFYNAAGEEQEHPAWIVVGVIGTNADGYQVQCVVIDNEGEARSAYFKVHVGETYSNLVTINQAAYVAPAGPGTWVLTNLADLTEDDIFAIVGTYEDVEHDSYAMSNDNGTGAAPSAVGVTIVNNTLSEEPNANLQWNIGVTDDGYIFYPNGTTETWLYCTNTNNGVRVGTNDNNIFVMDEGYLKHVATSRYVGIYNTQDWRCYTNTTGNIVNQSFAFYKRVDTPASESYTLYIPGYNDPTNPDGGYYLIASPVSTTPAAAGMITDEATDPEEFTYDFFYFDQNANDGLEWRNYRTQSFDIDPGKGYLYASKNGADLTFTGTPYIGNGEFTLSYTDNADFAGWNLVGNPFGYTATVDKDFYIMNEEGTEIISAEEQVVACMQGIFVVATAAGQKVTFEEYEAPIVPFDDKIVMNVTHNRGTVIDRAIVRFGEGEQLPKFQLFENNTKLYIPQGNSDYAIVRSAAEGEMPVNFKAKENGTYTISVNTENVEMEYLHLIDNMTGANVDLLATPSYTFEATTRDYASRFRLVFSANNNAEGNANFAYFNGSEWQISNIGEATLQVVDVMGRIVKNVALEGNATVSINEMPGVYMMRLLNGNDVKVQKVVIR